MEFFDTTITDEAKKLVQHCLNSERISEGEMVANFEKALWQWYPNSFTVNSGTSALHLALVLAGVGRGDEVILPAQTFVATGLAILYQDAVPVFCDIEYHTGNIDPNKARDLITPKTKAILAVAWGGLPPNLKALREICDTHNLKLIVDNAHAFGVKVEYEDFSCFSFQAIKPLTTGDGGLVVCKDSKDCDRGWRLRWFGIDRREAHTDPLTGERIYNLREVGYKYHMNDLSAAIGLGNINRLFDRQVRRWEIAQRYDEKLSKYATFHEDSSCWLYTLLVPDRDNFVRMMNVRGIPVSVVHVGIQRNDLFKSNSKLPVQESWDKEHICIPCHPKLTDDDVERVIDFILRSNVGRLSGQVASEHETCSYALILQELYQVVTGKGSELLYYDGEPKP